MTSSRKTIWSNGAVVLALLLTGALTRCLSPDEPGNLVPKTVAEDPSLPAIAVNGTRLHAEVFGDPQGPILIFTHGGPGGDYRAMISEIGAAAVSRYPGQRVGSARGLARLQDRFYSLFYDQRGSGLSPRFDPGIVHLDLLVEDLDKLVELMIAKKKQATGIVDTRVSLFGYSFGGVLATAYVNAHPGRVKDVITYEHGPLTKGDLDLLTMTSPFAELATTKVDEWLYNAEHISADTHARADFMQYVGVNRYPPEFHNNEREPFWRVGAFVKLDIDAYGSAIAGDRIVDNLGAFKGRLLYIISALNEALDEAGVKAFASHYPDYRIVEIPGTGHAGPWEAAGAVVKAVRDFL